MNKIAYIIAEKSQQLAIQLVPKIVSMARDLAIENIGTSLENIIPACPPLEKLQKILELRNQLVNKLNTTANTIDSLSKTLEPLTKTIDTSEKALTVAQAAEAASLLAMELTPIPPGVPGALISATLKLDKAQKFLEPIIVKNKVIVSSIETSLDYTNNTILKLIGYLNSIDAKLKYCGANNLNPYNNYINTLINTKEDVPKNNIYKGFILEIEVVPYTSTVNRRKAVAKNSQGIVLLQTPLSFTTLDEVLISELKLIIDANNLRAD